MKTRQMKTRHRHEAYLERSAARRQPASETQTPTTCAETKTDGRVELPRRASFQRNRQYHGSLRVWLQDAPQVAASFLRGLLASVQSTLPFPFALGSR